MTILAILFVVALGLIHEVVDYFNDDDNEDY